MCKADWHPADIVAAIRKSGTTLRELSLSHGLAERACQVALHRPYTKPEVVIAKALGVHPMVIWPSRYHADGTRIRFLHSKMLAKKTPLDTKITLAQQNNGTINCPQNKTGG